jgi:hypothetical protein
MKTVLFLFLIFITGCTKSDSDNTPDNLPKSADTKPQYNNTNFGFYKGVVIGSTGTIVIRINNGDNIIKAYLSISGTKDTLSTTQSFTAGQAIVNALFTGNLSSFSFSADADGSNARINNLSITGHPGAEALIVHENSNLQVYCYEGSFTGDYTGTISFVRIGNYQDNINNPLPLRYLARFNIDNFCINGRGQYDVDTSGTYSHYFYETTPGGTIRNLAGRGKFNGNIFSGAWTSWWPAVGGKNGTFSCNRTY